MKKNIAVLGMAVMGKNLALNIADHGFKVVIYNRTTQVMLDVLNESSHPNLFGAQQLEELVEQLEKPRKLILMVKAGKPVDALIDQLLPLLEKGDIIIDAGNSYYPDTIRREKYLNEQGMHFVGMGVSGGEEGARFGPAIMPGGNKEAHEALRPILEAIAAKVQGEACTTYIGPNGSGHYVKMIHNGIEYGDMQLIAEAYHLLKHVAKLSNQELAEVFDQFNQSELNSYLIEITAHIFKTKDDLTELDIIDVIKDTAGQKGTGIWTSKEALDLGINTSVMTSAVFARFSSAQAQQRANNAQIFKAFNVEQTVNKDDFINQVRRALYLGKIISYTQGFALLRTASELHQWDLDYKAIAKIFRGGCIIRAQFLNHIASAYEINPKLELLILDDYFKKIVDEAVSELRQVVAIGTLQGIGIPALSSALSYYDALRSPHLSTNLIQAQRDYFGAHTYERVDREGFFHFENWGKDLD
jgi:6-phosphogluconate dehydrogenase